MSGQSRRRRGTETGAGQGYGRRWQDGGRRQQPVARCRRARRSGRQARRGHHADRRGWDNRHAADDRQGWDGRDDRAAAGRARAGRPRRRRRARAGRPRRRRRSGGRRAAADETPPTTTPPAPPLRFAVIGDYGATTPTRRDVAALVHGWNPDLVITTGDNNYPSGDADDDRREHRQVLPRLHRQLPRRLRPGQRDQPLLAVARQPRLGRGRPHAVHRLLHAARQRALLRRRPRPRPPLRGRQRRREPDGISASSMQARWLKERWRRRSRASTSSTSTTRRIRSGAHGAVANMRLAVRGVGRGVGARRPRPQLRAPRRSAASRTSSTGTGGAGRKPFASRRCPRPSSATRTGTARC